MALGSKRNGGGQGEIWVAAADVAVAPGHPFYLRLNRILEHGGFDAWVEARCARFYAPVMGRPGLAPGIYFRMLLIGFFEGLDSERGIAWRVADSRTLGAFLGVRLDQATPDHSTLSKTRQRIDVETHQAVFDWILVLLAREGLLKGKTIGVDATTLEANAAMRSIVRRDTGESYREYLKGLARQSGIETPTTEDLARIDKSRKNKASNDDWQHPHDPDARIAKMKDGTTHLAHKAEHAVDLETGALTAVTLNAADEGDTATLPQTLDQVEINLDEAAVDEAAQRQLAAPSQRARDVVADKGYHSAAVLEALEQDERKSYLSEPDRGRRKWRGRDEEQNRTYDNRRRVSGGRGKRLLRRRAELAERSFAHMYETGGMRRLYLRGRENILKRLLIQGGGFNLALLLRKILGAGKPRAWAALGAAVRSICAHAARRFARWTRGFGRKAVGTDFGGVLLAALSTRLHTWLKDRKLTLSTGC